MLIPGDSLLARLEALESISEGYVTFQAGSWIQTDKIVALTASGIVHADCRVPEHAGLVVGIAIESGSPGDMVRVQQLGVYELVLSTFSQIGSAMVGINGGVAFAVPTGATFVQFIGTVISNDSVIIDIDNSVIIP